MSLGKGLGSLIPPRTNKIDVGLQARASQFPGAQSAVLEVPLKQVRPNPYQPRREFDQWQLEDLVKSIKEHGILQPLIVTQLGEGYQLIAGERRLKAAALAGLKKVPIIVRQASDLEKLELALIENIQRTDLNPIEKAEAYQKLLTEFSLTQEEAAKRLGQPRSSVANSLRLLTLPQEIQAALAQEKITEGHAKALLSLKDATEQLKLFRTILQNRLSVRDLESQLVAQRPAASRFNRRSLKDPQLQSWEEELQEKLQTKVQINKKGENGYLKITFYSGQELAALIKKISRAN